jgi:hypothetical protein
MIIVLNLIRIFIVGLSVYTIPVSRYVLMLVNHYMKTLLFVQLHNEV